jgi:hypothetical protein
VCWGGVCPSPQVSIKGFKDGEFNVLIATDVAGRGIDVPDVALVVNYDMPNNIEAYTHRWEGGACGRRGGGGRRRGAGLSVHGRRQSRMHVFDPEADPVPVDCACAVCVMSVRCVGIAPHLLLSPPATNFPHTLPHLPETPHHLQDWAYGACGAQGSRSHLPHRG